MKHASAVGGISLAFVALLIGAYAFLGQALFAPKLTRYSAVFADAGGAVPGSTVLLSGVPVGTVQEVKLERAGRAIVVLAVNSSVQIPQGTEAILTASLVGFGDKPVELIPPSSSSAFVSPGGEIPGRIKGALEGVIPDTSETLAELNKTLRATQELIGDQEMRGKLVTLLESSNKTITEFGQLAARIDSVTAENQGTLRQTLLQASAMLGDVSKATQAVARIATEGKFERKTMALLDEMTASVKQGQGLVADLRKTVNDPELQGPMKQILSNTEQMTQSGTRIASNAEVMTKNGIELSEKAIEIAEKASKLADELSDVLKKFESTFDKLGGITGGAAGAGIGRLETEVTMLRETDPGRFRAEMTATIPIGENRYTLGLWDAFESNKLIAQIGYDFNDSTKIRYGVFASQVGVGVESRIAPGVWLRGDLYDFNEPRFDLRAQYELRHNLRLLFGIDRVFGQNTPTIGVSLRR